MPPILIIFGVFAIAYLLYRLFSPSKATPEVAEKAKAEWGETVAAQALGLEKIAARCKRAGGVRDASLPSESHPNITISRITEADIIPLQDIYDAMDGVLVPRGNDEEFTVSITRASSLYLVCKINGVVVGGGGVNAPQTINNTAHTQFFFGVVKPEFQRRGIGSLLLLARLAAISTLKEVVGVRLDVLPAGAAVISPMQTHEFSEAKQAYADGYQTQCRVMFLAQQNLRQAEQLLTEFGVSVTGDAREYLKACGCRKSG